MAALNKRKFETLSEFYSILCDFTFRMSLLRSDLNSDNPDEFDEIILRQVTALLQFAGKAKRISRDSFQTKDSPLWYVWQLTPKSYLWNGCQANSVTGIAEAIVFEFSEQCRKAWRYPAEAEAPCRFTLNGLASIDSGEWPVVMKEHAESLAPCIVGLAHGLQEWFQSWPEDESFLSGLIIDLNYEMSLMRKEHEDQEPEWSPPLTPARLRRIFAVNGQAISQNTLKRRIEKKIIRIHPTRSTTKSIIVDMRDLSTGWEEIK